MKKIKNIIFDFGGVLLDLNLHGCMAAFKALGLDDIDQMISTAHQKGLFSHFEDGTITSEQFCQGIREAIIAKHPSAQPTDEEITKAWEVMGEGIPPYKLSFVAELTKMGYHVSALSNTNAIHWNYCRHMFTDPGFAPEEIFEHVWLSNELHLVKPDLAIFKAILADSNYVADETLFIDDSLLNCEAAKQVGLQAMNVSIRTDWRDDLKKFLLQ